MVNQKNNGVNTQIENSTVIKQSQVAKQDLFSYSPKSLSAEQYMNVAKEVMTLA